MALNVASVMACHYMHVDTEGEHVIACMVAGMCHAPWYTNRDLSRLDQNNFNIEFISVWIVRCSGRKFRAGGRWCFGPYGAGAEGREFRPPGPGGLPRSCPPASCGGVKLILNTDIFFLSLSLTIFFFILLTHCFPQLRRFS